MSVKNQVIKICTVCGIKYNVRADRANSSKYCSKKCWSERRVLKICEYCEKEITSYHAKKYCSRDCAHKAMVGNKSSAWIDGKSLERDRARLGSKLKKWKKDVHKRDNYTCQMCGKTGKIHAHHKIEWAKDESKRFDVENGITLCIKCHGEMHGKDFTKRDKKKCPSCGKTIKRESKFCHSCATKKQWQDPKYCQVIIDRMKKLDPDIEVTKL